MIQKDNKKILDIYVGVTPVDQVTNNDSVRFLARPYILVYSDSTSSANQVSWYLEKKGKSPTYVRNNVNASNSPVKFKITVNSGETIECFTYYSGSVTKVEYRAFNFSIIASLKRIVRYYGNHPAPVFKEIELTSCLFPEGYVFKSGVSGFSNIEAITNKGSVAKNPGDFMRTLSDLPDLRTADLSLIKMQTSSKESRSYSSGIVENCQSLEELDISGIEVDFQELLEVLDNKKEETNFELKTQRLLVPYICEDCPKINRVRVTMSYFKAANHLVTISNWSNMLGVPNSWFKPSDWSYSTLKNLEHIEIADLDSHRDELQ